MSDTQLFLYIQTRLNEIYYDRVMYRNYSSHLHFLDWLEQAIFNLQELYDYYQEYYPLIEIITIPIIGDILRFINENQQLYLESNYHFVMIRHNWILEGQKSMLDTLINHGIYSLDWSIKQFDFNYYMGVYPTCRLKNKNILRGARHRRRSFTFVYFSDNWELVDFGHNQNVKILRKDNFNQLYGNYVKTIQFYPGIDRKGARFGVRKYYDNLYFWIIQPTKANLDPRFYGLLDLDLFWEFIESFSKDLYYENMRDTFDYVFKNQDIFGSEYIYTFGLTIITNDCPFSLNQLPYFWHLDSIRSIRGWIWDQFSEDHPIFKPVKYTEINLFDWKEHLWIPMIYTDCHRSDLNKVYQLITKERISFITYPNYPDNCTSYCREIIN